MIDPVDDLRIRLNDLEARVGELERRQVKFDLWVEGVSVKIEAVIELQRRIASLSGINGHV
jgi:hypothetical protein